MLKIYIFIEEFIKECQAGLEPPTGARNGNKATMKV